MRLLVISDYRDTQAVRPEAEWMLRLSRENVHIHIITFPGTVYEKEFKNAGIKVYLNHPHRKYDRTFIRFIRTVTKQYEYQIFYLFNSKAIINGIQAAKKLNVKVLLYRGYTGHIHWYDPTAYFKYLHPRVDVITCLAQSIKDHLERQWFFSSEKAVTLNKGHDPQWYQGIPPLDLQEFGVPPDAFVVACMGNARAFKGIRYLLQATYQLSEISDCYLLLIGRDMTKGSLRGIWQNSPMREKIIPTGWRKDVLSILGSVQTFVLPSIGGEATTKSLIEAMSMGCAPIATDIPGNKGLVIDQQTGLEIPTKNPAAIASAIRSLYDDRERARKFGRAAKMHIAEKFHISRTVQETLVLFKEITAK